MDSNIVGTKPDGFNVGMIIVQTAGRDLLERRCTIMSASISHLQFTYFIFCYSIPSSWFYFISESFSFLVM